MATCAGENREDCSALSTTCGVCQSGYKDVSGTCVDVCDAGAKATCAANNREDCSANDITCGACFDGYEGSGKKCTDINDCASGPCKNGGTCTDTGVHSHTCDCATGWEGNQDCLTNINECSASGLNNCHADATCVDIPGSFVCACKSGYSGDGVTCADIDDCADDPCKNGGTCTDTGPHTHTCDCATGWQGDQDCQTNIDECSSSGLNNCHADATCTDNDGSYSCACNPGYSGDGV